MGHAINIAPGHDKEVTKEESAELKMAKNSPQRNKLCGEFFIVKYKNKRLTEYCQKYELTNAYFKPFVSPDFEARGIEKVEALLVIFAKLRKWLYFEVFYDFAFSSFK